MREYSYHATDASIEALRQLMDPWADIAATEREVAITTATGAVVRLSVERAEIEGQLDVSRLRADVVTTDEASPANARAVPLHDLGRGRNEVVLFAGESWIENAPGEASGDGAANVQTMQFTGRAGQRPESATIVCTTTDAIVVAASTGEGVLIRIGVRPSTLDIVQDRVAIARFLVQRGYASEDQGGS